MDARNSEWKLSKKRGIYTISIYLLKRHLFITKGKIHNFVVKKPGRHHLRQQTKVRPPTKERISATCLLVPCTEEDTMITSVVFLPEACELHLVMRKHHHTNPDWGTGYKTVLYPTKMSRSKRQRKPEEHCPTFKETNET